MQGLQTTALDLLTRFRDLLQSQVAAFQSKGPRSGRHLTICKAVMDLFGAYAPWLLPSTLLSLGVIPMLIALLRLPELAAEACFVLSCLSTRKYAKVDGEFKSLLLRHIPPAVCEVLAAPSAELFQNVQSVMAVTLVGIVDSLLAWACSEISVHARLAQEVC